MFLLSATHSVLIYCDSFIKVITTEILYDYNDLIYMIIFFYIDKNMI